jgi:hypothetical protein
MKILIVSAEAFPGHEERNLPLAEELIRRGHEVIHTGPAAAMADHGFTATTFDDAFAGRPNSKRANTRLFTRWHKLVDMIDWCQVVLFGTAKGYKRFAEYASREGKVILWQRDLAVEHLRADYADRLAVRGSHEVDTAADFFGMPEEKIFPVGCVQLDQAAAQHRRLDRAAFCEKYGLDINKKIAVFLSTAPAGHHKLVQENYRGICRAVRELADFELIIKPHPREYARNKQTFHYEWRTSTIASAMPP